MNLSIGDKIRWESSIGVIRGDIRNITLAPAASGEIIPWIDVEYLIALHSVVVRLCASDSNIKMMRIAKVS